MIADNKVKAYMHLLEANNENSLFGNEMNVEALIVSFHPINLETEKDASIIHSFRISGETIICQAKRKEAEEKISK